MLSVPWCLCDALLFYNRVLINCVICFADLILLWLCPILFLSTLELFSDTAGNIFLVRSGFNEENFLVTLCLVVCLKDCPHCVSLLPWYKVKNYNYHSSLVPMYLGVVVTTIQSPSYIMVIRQTDLVPQW